MWAAARRSDRILTVSEASKRDILHFFDVPPEKVVVVYNAIDERFSREPRAEDVERVRERFQLHQRFVLYVGNIKPHKNLVRLIEAFHALRRAASTTSSCSSSATRSRSYPSAAAGRAPAQAAQARALPRVSARRHARHPVPAGVGVRVPVVV